MKTNHINLSSPLLRRCAKITVLLFYLWSSIVNMQAQTPFEDFKKRAESRYSQWKENMGVISTSGDEARYSKKIELNSEGITVWSLIVGVSSYTSMQSLKYACLLYTSDAADD